MSSARLDRLLAMQADSQKFWEDHKTFEADSPADFDFEAAEASAKAGHPLRKRKFMATFPYPYMNGRLHIGHLFTVTKAEFAAGFHRQLGENVIFPFGLHCTGMPIKAAADRLAHEVELFRPYGPAFPPTEEMVAQYKADLEAAEAAAEQENAEQETAAGEAAAEAAEAAAIEVAAMPKQKFKSKRSKLTAKSGNAKFQYEIMRISGVPDEEIPAFVDPRHWIYYFPQHCVADLKEFGARVDWRRSFITTDANPYYDSFVRWQFTMLKERGKIKYGKRYCIYSPLDGQPCADHERSVGEGVDFQEYTVIKMTVALEDRPACMRSPELDAKKITLGAATLRPETMYGQTNAWALPDGEYGVYEIAENECMVMCAHAARGMAYQDYTTSGEMGVPRCLATLTGRDLIGTRVTSPLAPAPVYVLPLLTISMTKGTGIVTSVPADAPDDFAALRDLRTSPELRAEYGVSEEWLAGTGNDVIEIISIDGLPVAGAKGKDAATCSSTCSAVYMCDFYNVKTQHDRAKLDLAKGVCYSKGFRDGVLVTGPHAGEKVEDAKDVVKQEMLAAGDAILFCEPESDVISRSGDLCLVAKVAQWYIDYGEETWRGEVEDYVRNHLGTNDTTVRNLFLDAVAWLRQWSCSREFGLGTKLPFDERYLVESLSDSTLYMAFYTVCHLLMSSNPLDGSNIGPLGIPASALTPAVWSAVILGENLPADAEITVDQLRRLRREFLYWYPMDLRVSGKDLIRNHLTMTLYNHAAAFPGRTDMWPQAYASNGFLLVDNEKMAKSKGNFFTAVEIVRKYSSDAVRAAMAEASDDPIDSANYSQAVSAAHIVKLGMLDEFFVRAAAALADPEAAGLASADAPMSDVDCAFATAMNQIIAECKEDYNARAYARVSASIFARIISARNAWLQRTFNERIPNTNGNYFRDRRPENFRGLHPVLLRTYLENHARIIAPICPHSACYWWRHVLGHTDQTVHDAGWPEPIEIANPDAARAIGRLHDEILPWAAELYAMAKAGRVGLSKGATPVPQKVLGLRVTVATSLPSYCEAALTALRAAYGPAGWTQPPMKVAGMLAKSGAIDKLYAKRAQTFCTNLIADVEKRGEAAFNYALPYDQIEVINALCGHLTVVYGLENGVEVVEAGAGSDILPGRPLLNFVTVPENN